MVSACENPLRIYKSSSAKNIKAIIKNEKDWTN